MQQTFCLVRRFSFASRMYFFILICVDVVSQMFGLGSIFYLFYGGAFCEPKTAEFLSGRGLSAFYAIKLLTS